MWFWILWRNFGSLIMNHLRSMTVQHERWNVLVALCTLLGIHEGAVHILAEGADIICGQSLSFKAHYHMYLIPLTLICPKKELHFTFTQAYFAPSL